MTLMIFIHSGPLQMLLAHNTTLQFYKYNRLIAYLGLSSLVSTSGTTSGNACYVELALNAINNPPAENALLCASSSDAIRSS